MQSKVGTIKHFLNNNYAKIIQNCSRMSNNLPEAKVGCFSVHNVTLTSMNACNC